MSQLFLWFLNNFTSNEKLKEKRNRAKRKNKDFLRLALLTVKTQSNSIIIFWDLYCHLSNGQQYKNNTLLNFKSLKSNYLENFRRWLYSINCTSESLVILYLPLTIKESICSVCSNSSAVFFDICSISCKSFLVIIGGMSLIAGFIVSIINILPFNFLKKPACTGFFRYRLVEYGFIVLFLFIILLMQTFWWIEKIIVWKSHLFSEFGTLLSSG